MFSDVITQLSKLFWRSRSQMRDIKKSRTSEKAHQDFVKTNFQQMLKDKLEYELFYSNKILEAAIVRDKKFSRWIGLKNHETLILGLNLQNPKAQQWLLRQLKRIFHESKNLKLRIILSGDLVCLQPKLEKIGYTFEDSYWVGSPSQAYKKLRAHLKNKHSKLPDNLILKEISNSQEIEAVLRLKRKVFRLQREYGWFCDNSRYLQSDREELQKYIKLSTKRREKMGKALILIDSSTKGKVLGLGSVFYFKESLPFKACGGMDYCFDPSLQGKGYGSLVFLELLKAMQGRTAVFTGHTSNPAIIRLAEITQRTREQVFMMN